MFLLILMFWLRQLLMARDNGLELVSFDSELLDNGAKQPSDLV